MKDGDALQADQLYQSFLQTTDEAESQSLLTRLLSECADPVIKEIIAYKLRAAFDGARDTQEAEDIYHNVVISLLTRLRACKQQSEANPIGNFRSYVATITYNACANHLREKYPQRHILKNRLRYFLTHEAGFALWESGPWLCGFASWQADRKAAAGSHSLGVLRDQVKGFPSAGATVEDLGRTRLKELLTQLFDKLGQPIEIDDLVKLIAEVCGLKDKLTQADNREETSIQVAELLPDSRIDVETEFARRAYLQKLWAEICELPNNQRVALLLNLKDAQGGGGIALFPLTGIANFRRLAQALSISAEALAQLWNDLPLDDLAIAGRLGVTRQQVINLRKAARARLARRLRDD